MMMKTFLIVLVAALAACGASGGDGDTQTPGFEDSRLDTYELAVLPDFSVLPELLERPDERFVMVNMLVFKDMATGEGFEDLSGRDAYQIYIEGLSEAQIAIGSRLIWAGQVQAQVVGSSDPVFQSMALLEYASPSAFLGFASSPGEAPEARSAGLLGQWLVASTTIEEGNPSTEPATSEELPSTEELVRTTGLTAEQIGRVLDGPADEPVFIVELLRFADESGDAYRPYRDALTPVVEAWGGGIVWCGAYDAFILGNASPGFHEMVVTGYPSRAAYLSVLSDPNVVAASNARVDGLAAHWIYTAGNQQIDLGF